MDQVEGARAVPDLDSVAGGGGILGVDQPRSAAPGLDREAAPELEAPVDLERLPAVNRREADALAAHPHHGVETAADQGLGQARSGAILRDAAEVVVELVFRVGAEIGDSFVLVGQVRHQTGEVGNAVVGDAHRAGAEAAVAAALGLRSAFDNQRPGAALARGQRRA